MLHVSLFSSLLLLADITPQSVLPVHSSVSDPSLLADITLQSVLPVHSCVSDPSLLADITLQSVLPLFIVFCHFPPECGPPQAADNGTG